MNEDDWQNLSTFWETLPFRSLVKWVDIQVYNAAQNALTASTMEEVADQRGYARALKGMIKEIENADKKLAKIKGKGDNEEKKEN